MSKHDIIVVGTSAGGVEALVRLVHDLPADLPAIVFIVIHVPARGQSRLPEILSRSGPLEAIHPTDGLLVSPGHIYVAPPDHHMLVEQGHVRVVRGPKENRHRPAIDPLLRSAALVYGPQVVGVILTGALDDGTAGLLAIKQRGGVAVVQDPREALYAGMPQNALANVSVDYCVPLADMGSLLTRLAGEEAPDTHLYPVSQQLEKEVREKVLLWHAMCCNMPTSKIRQN